MLILFSKEFNNMKWKKIYSKILKNMTKDYENVLFMKFIVDNYHYALPY